MNAGEVILYLSGMAAALSGLWRLVIKPGAQAIAAREVTAPVLAAIAKMSPPLLTRLDEIDRRLSELEKKP